MTRYRFTISLIMLGFFLVFIAPVLPTIAWSLDMISPAEQIKFQKHVWSGWVVYGVIWAVYLVIISIYDRLKAKREKS